MIKANVLAELRKKQGLSQEEAAAALGVARQTVSRWEKGISEPTGENLRAIAQFYQVLPESLVNTEPELPDEEKTEAVPTEVTQISQDHPAMKKRLRRRWVIAALLVLLAIAAAGMLHFGSGEECDQIDELEKERWDDADSKDFSFGW